MPFVALVLGAGGLVGRAFHVGVLDALAEHRAWDPRRADLVVGTSAGAALAANLRAGLAAPDLFARTVGERVSPEAEELIARLPPHRPLPDGRREGLPLPPANPVLVVPAALGQRVGIAWAGLAPRGTGDHSSIAEEIRALHPRHWPAQPTWLCAVRLRDGRRVVFGRDDRVFPDLGTAVEASTAVPGRFRPVRIGGADHVDGGAWSATNADLVAGLGFDTVVVSSPMSGGDGWARAYHRWHLDREVAAIRRSGSRVVVLQPEGDLAARMAGDSMDAARVPEVARAARAFAVSALDDEEAQEALGTRPSQAV
ncbi:MAG: patatin-like phospholipase family protein [Acidimicrobiales bacterium]|nr:patatin-like phospholipase family protein [Acidimicrobiales bacterium]